MQIKFIALFEFFLIILGDAINDWWFIILNVWKQNLKKEWVKGIMFCNSRTESTLLISIFCDNQHPCIHTIFYFKIKSAKKSVFHTLDGNMNDWLKSKIIHKCVLLFCITTIRQMHSNPKTDHIIVYVI